MTPTLIFDIGGHVGQDTDFYLKCGFHVVTVEANPDLAAGLRRRLHEAIDAGRLQVVEAAVSDRSGSGTFYKFEKSVFGTTSPDWRPRNSDMGDKYEEIAVTFVTMDELFARFGCPYYMKIDIEGADMLCVEALRGLKKPTYLSVEVEKFDLSKFEADVALIRDLGYTAFQLVQQEAVPFSKRPNPPREGRPATHRFPFGASGMFGRDLPADRWLGIDELLRAYQPVIRRHHRFGDLGLGRSWLPRQVLRGLRLYPGWHDLHCRLAGVAE